MNEKRRLHVQTPSCTPTANDNACCDKVSVVPDVFVKEKICN